MERRLETAVDLLETGMNFMLFVGMETVADAAFGGFGTPLYVLFFPLAAPLLFYVLRRRLDSLFPFLFLHLAVPVALGKLGSLCPTPLLWQIAFTAVGAVYAFSSLRIRLTSQEDGEGVLAGGFMAVMAAAAFWALSYLDSKAGCERILWLVLWWLAGYWIRSYLANFLGYMQMNRRASGAMPEDRIFKGGLVLASVYGGFSLIALVLCSRTALMEYLTEGVRRAWRLLAWILSKFFSLFAGGEEEFVEMPEPEIMGEQAMLLPPGQEPPWWMEILEKIVMTALALLMIAAFLAMVFMLIRFVVKSFYGRKRVRREVLQEGYVEEEERLERKKNHTGRGIPAIGGTPGQRVRRIFRKAVWQGVREEGKKASKSSAANSRLLMDMAEIQRLAEQEQKGEVRKEGAAGLKARTARELALLCAGKTEEPSKAAKEWEALTALYEKARYTQESITKEDVRRAAHLSTRLGR